MDYQCIVIYTIVRIAPFYPSVSQSNLNAPSCSTKREQSKSSNGCLDWIKLQIKRYRKILLRRTERVSAFIRCNVMMVERVRFLLGRASSKGSQNNILISEAESLARGKGVLVLLIFHIFRRNLNLFHVWFSYKKEIQFSWTFSSFEHFHGIVQKYRFWL